MKKKISTLMLFTASLLFSYQSANAQTWNIAGNSNATATSKLGTTNNIPLRLFTNNVERIHINANTSGKVGFVGIGTASPVQKLHVVGNATFTGNVGIGITTPTYKLHVVGGAGNGIYGSGDSYGVYGYSSTGFGVTGSSGYLGVYGTGSSYGLYGGGGTYGAYASGTDYGVYGYSSTGYGVSGTSGNNYGLYGSGNIGSIAYGDYVGAWGDGTSYGLVGYGGPYGVWATGTTWGGYFAGNVYCSGTYSGSDRALKKNITEFNSATDIINKLKPRQYEYRNDGHYAQMNLPEGSHYGLIAQDVELVLPNLVKATEFNTNMKRPAPLKTDQDGNPVKTAENVAAPKSETIDFKAVNYTELIPIIIKAMQEQDQKIMALEAENAQMKQDLQSCCLNHSNAPADAKQKDVSTDEAWLEQNAPNPFSEQTIIRYYLPSGNAILKVVSLDGEQVMTKELNETGYGEVLLSANTLAAGAYTYSLIINGKAMESKIMVLTK